MSKRPSKIAYVVSLFPCWSETFILNEIIELSKRGVDISILSIRSDLEDHIHDNAKFYMAKTTYVDTFKMIWASIKWSILKPHVVFPLLTTVIFKKYKSTNIWLKNIWSVFVGCYFANFIKEEKIEHIHAHFATYPTVVAMVTSKLTDVPFTFTAHAHDIYLKNVLLRDICKAAKRIVTISQYNRRFISDYCGNGTLKKIEVIHCGLDLSTWQSPGAIAEGQEAVIVSIGRLTRMKGFEFLVKACHHLKNHIPFKCYIVGDGHLRTELEQLIDELQLQDHVVLTGVLDSREVRNLLNQTKIFVMPSVWDDEDGQDGIPLVLMEAMALGKPSIASRLSGLPELVVDKDTGLLVNPGDEKQLADKILELVKDKDLQLKLSMNGRLKVEDEFNIEKNAGLLAELF